MNRMFVLNDPDGDGTIIIDFTPNHSGVNINIMDMFENEVATEFYKDDLVKYLREVLNELENEQV